MKSTQAGTAHQHSGQPHDGHNIWKTVAREWDVRVNLHTPPPEDQEPNLQEAKLQRDLVVDKIKELCEKGWFAYCLVSGIEKGDNPAHGDYGRYHVHMALRFTNNKSGSAIINRLSLSRLIGDPQRRTRAFYLKPRDQSLPFLGWVDHHKKSSTKVNPDEPISFEFGKLPKHVERALSVRENGGQLSKNASQDEKILEIIKLYKQGLHGEALELYPSIVLRHHGALAARVIAERHESENFDHSPCLWVYGPPGTGKSAFVQYKYPGIYQKSIARNEIGYWGGFDPLKDTHFLIEDVGHETFLNIGVDQLKQWSDPSQGITMAIKYLPPLQGIRAKMVVTSNFTIQDLLPPGKGIEENKAALLRRFRMVHIKDLLREEGLTLVSTQRLRELKLSGNRDYSKCFKHVEEPYESLLDQMNDAAKDIPCSSEDPGENSSTLEADEAITEVLATIRRSEEVTERKRMALEELEHHRYCEAKKLRRELMEMNPREWEKEF